jgi:hypothetical protein
VNDIQAIVQILAKGAPELLVLQGLFVAPMMRTSVRTLSLPPTLSNSRSCITRSSLTCMFNDMSPISSSNRGP